MALAKPKDLKADALVGERDYVPLMLTSKAIEAIALNAASKRLSKGAIEGVASADAIDSEGSDAVRITIILKQNAAKKLKGDDVLDALVDIRNALLSAGESRTPIIEYAEIGEAVAADGDA